MRIIICLILLVNLISPGRADPILQDWIEDVLQGYPGIFGVAIENLISREITLVNGELKFPTASTIKVPIMVEVFQQIDQGKLSLDDTFIIREEDKVGGSGTLQNKTGDIPITLGEALELMISISDNTASNVCIDAVGGLWEGINRINCSMEELGLSYTRLMNKLMGFSTKRNYPDSLRYGVGVTRPVDMMLLLEKIYRKEAASPESCQQMLEILKRGTGKSMLLRNLPEGTLVAHKNGTVSGVRADMGIIFSPAGPLIVCAFTEENKNDGLATEKIGEVTRLVYDYYNP